MPNRVHRFLLPAMPSLIGPSAKPGGVEFLSGRSPCSLPGASTHQTLRRHPLQTRKGHSTTTPWGALRVARQAPVQSHHAAQTLSRRLPWRSGRALNPPLHTSERSCSLRSPPPCADAGPLLRRSGCCGPIFTAEVEHDLVVITEFQPRLEWLAASDLKPLMTDVRPLSSRALTCAAASFLPAMTFHTVNAHPVSRQALPPNAFDRSMTGSPPNGHVPTACATRSPPGTRAEDERTRRT